MYCGVILLVEKSTRISEQLSLCIAFHYGKFIVTPRCILAWESLISSLNTRSFTFLSKALSNVGVMGFHTQDVSGSLSLSAIFLPMLWSSLCNSCCFDSEGLLSKFLSTVSQYPILQAGDQLCEPLAVPPLAASFWPPAGPEVSVATAVLPQHEEKVVALVLPCILTNSLHPLFALI